MGSIVSAFSVDSQNGVFPFGFPFKATTKKCANSNNKKAEPRHRTLPFRLSFADSHRRRTRPPQHADAPSARAPHAAAPCDAPPAPVGSRCSHIALKKGGGAMKTKRKKLAAMALANTCTALTHPSGDRCHVSGNLSCYCKGRLAFEAAVLHFQWSQSCSYYPVQHYSQTGNYIMSVAYTTQKVASISVLCGSCGISPTMKRKRLMLICITGRVWGKTTRLCLFPALPKVRGRTRM